MNDINDKKLFHAPRWRELAYFLPIIASVFVLVLAFFGDKPEGWGILYLSVSVLSILTMLFFTVTDVKIPFFVREIIFALIPAASCVLLENFIHNPFGGDIKPKILLLNFAFYYLLSLFLLSLTGRQWPGVFACTVIAAVAGLSEHFVLIFRDAPLFVWDLRSIGVASTVVSNYSFTFTFGMSMTLSLLCLLLTFGFRFSAKLEKFRGVVAVRIVSCVITASLLCGYVYYVNLDRSYTDFGMYPYLFTPKVVYSDNGFTVAFLSMLRYLNIKAPDGYDDDSLDRIAEKYGLYDEDTEDKTNGDAPNIIVIMNEAFSDLSVLTDFETNIERMPFLSSLSENTYKANLHVSVLGGNTANTEFEFLTGMTMAYLPQGSVPYQQYVKEALPSIASHLSDVGYSTQAIHPYIKNGWDRDKVYPWFGFDEFLAKSDLKGLSVIRKYVSDISVYRYIMNEYKHPSNGSPSFIFNVTMQNHGSYTTTYANFNHKRVTAVGLEGDAKLSMYLSLVRKSDDAIKTLIEFLSSYDEDTIVVFFGDHQPAATVSSKLLKKYHVTIDETDFAAREQRYIVPIYFWANYDIGNGKLDDFSANYINTVLCDIAGISLTPAQRFMKLLQEEFPVITANCFMTADGVLHSSNEMDEYEMLREYEMIEYNYLFDGADAKFFGY